MKRSIILLGVALTMGLAAAVPSHATVIDFDFYFYNTGDTISGNGTVSATPNGDGSYTAVSGSISVLIADTGTFSTFPPVSDGQSVNLNLTLLTSLSGYPATVPVANMIGSTSFTYDNLIYPASSTDEFDLDGLLFTDGVSYLNLLDMGGEPFYDTYAIFDPNSADLGNYLWYDSMTSAFTSASPEPSTFALLGAGLGLFVWRRRSRTA